MSNLKYSQFLFLRDTLNRPPIDLPAEINFGDNETLQRTPGLHHLPQFQKTGTYWHPNLCAQRLRVAEDRLKRAQDMRASDPELKKSPQGLTGMEEVVNQRKEELLMVLQGKHPEAKKLFDSEDNRVETQELPKVSLASTSMMSAVSPLKVSVPESEAEVPSAHKGRKGVRARKFSGEEIHAEPVDPREDTVAQAIRAAQSAGDPALKVSDED